MAVNSCALSATGMPGKTAEKDQQKKRPLSQM
jgi:hypothetical protein